MDITLNIPEDSVDGRVISLVVTRQMVIKTADNLIMETIKNVKNANEECVFVPTGYVGLIKVSSLNDSFLEEWKDDNFSCGKINGIQIVTDEKLKDKFSSNIPVALPIVSWDAFIKSTLDKISLSVERDSSGTVFVATPDSTIPAL